jgi:ATP-dependent DNA helicase RecG
MGEVIMQAEELVKLVNDTKRMKTEQQGIELKAANKGCPTRIFDTLSSFSNQDDGGIIIFGIDENKDYEVVGVYDAQDLQKKINEQCKQMEPVVRALFTVCEINGKLVVSAEIPSVDISERPVFYRGVGRVKGSYIRVGDSDEPMTEYEIYSYDAFRKRIKDDLRKVDNAKLKLFDTEKLEEYLNLIKREKNNLATNVNDQEILELMGVLNEDVPTLAGVMTFSKYPQAYFPQLCITAIVVPGTEIGETGSEGERFIDNKRITGTISEMLNEAVDFVRKNSRTMTMVNNNGVRQDKEEYPSIAIREAILNALVHRDYSIHTENIPIRLEMYRDRLVIMNSGGLYGQLTIDSLGKVRPETRNAILANMLEVLKITENRYSGIPTIRKECKNHGLPAPIFEVKHGEFSVTFKNSIYKLEGMKSSGDMNKDIIAFCDTPRSRAELVEFTGMSRQYTMKKIVQPLIENHLLKLTIPEKPRSSKQKYVKGK